MRNGKRLRCNATQTAPRRGKRGTSQSFEFRSLTKIRSRHVPCFSRCPVSDKPMPDQNPIPPPALLQRSRVSVAASARPHGPAFRFRHAEIEMRNGKRLRSRATRTAPRWGKRGFAWNDDNFNVRFQKSDPTTCLAPAEPSLGSRIGPPRWSRISISACRNRNAEWKTLALQCYPDGAPLGQNGFCLERR